MYDLLKYEFKKELTNEIAHSLDAFYDQCLPIVVKDRITNKTILICNVYADKDKKMNLDLSMMILRAKYLQIDYSIFVGCFNRNIELENIKLSPEELKMVKTGKDDHFHLVEKGMLRSIRPTITIKAIENGMFEMLYVPNKR